MAAACLTPLAIAILAGGLDDLIVDLVWFCGWLAGAVCRRYGRPCLGRYSGPAPPSSEKRIAIFVPLWREHAVIGRMLDHNIAAIDYRSYAFFVGAYPNDEATLEAVRGLESRHPQVHLAVCPHEGPTSKADCLNWIYQRMLLYEEQHNVEFDLVVTHDAEDLIHPASLRVMNEYADRFDMIQVPVLALATPLRELVHGLYCDEFAEFQTKDMRVRAMMGSFTPASGVGAGYTRQALEKLAADSSNCIFEPVCLAEDYENGMRLHQLGCRQIFIPLTANADRAVATREYFPRNLRAAIRQRTRWVTGIALQTWQRHGWSGPPGQVYWYWRDRKGLLGNPLSLLANILFFYGLATYWWLPAMHSVDRRLVSATLALFVWRASVRMACVGRLYGPVFALGVPLRAVCGNFINSVASVRALYRFTRAKIRREPLVWLKTEHGYPSRSTLLAHKRKLGEILTGSAYVEPDVLQHALEMKPHDMRLGEYLVVKGMLTEEELYEALSLQQGLPAGLLAAADIAPNAARALPRHVIRKLRVLPFKIASGSLHLATPDVPTDEMTRGLRGFTALEVHFRLVTPANFNQLLSLL